MPTQEEIENFTEFIEALREAAEAQEKMTEQEKSDNAIKMGDIYY